MNRPSWDQWFMEMAFVASLRATCLRRQIGAVLVKDNRVLAIGYNGPPPGLAHCEDLGGCLREKLKVPSGERHEICRAVHAELNTFLQAACLGGIAAEGATLYITNTPCSMCARAIAVVGIKRLVIAGDYPDEFSRKILDDAGIVIEKIERWQRMIETIEIIVGCMFSGKTEELIRRIKRAVIAGQGVQVFKPAVDTRYIQNEICSHGGPSFPATVVEKASDIFALLKVGVKVVAVDEVQFFDRKVVEVCRTLAIMGLRVICAGLSMDFRGEPFGSVPQLMAIADGGVTMLTAVCTVCGGEATRTQRLIDGKPAPYDAPVIQVGGLEAYQARCVRHHEVPGREVEDAFMGV